MSKNPKTVGLGFGLVFVAIGALSMIAMLRWPAGVKTELWIAEIAASTFVFAGLSFVAQSLGHKYGIALQSGGGGRSRTDRSIFLFW